MPSMSRIHLEFRSIRTAGCLAVVCCLHVHFNSLDFETSTRYLHTHTHTQAHKHTHTHTHTHIYIYTIYEQ